MTNKQAALVLCIFLAACATKPVQKTECPAVTPVSEKQEQTLSAAPQTADKTAQSAQILEKQTSPAAGKNAPAVSTADNTAPKEECEAETVTSEISDNTEVSAPDIPAEPSGPEKAAAWTASARKNQTSKTPAADTPSFDGEDSIPLENRRLSPLAYEPILENAPQTAPWKNEELKYGLYYSFIKAGTAYIKNRGLTKINGRDAYLIQTTAFSAPVIDAFFKVRDINYSWLDAENFYSLGYSQSIREGNYKRDEWLTFDYGQNAYYGEVQKKGDVSYIFGELNLPVLDMLTSLYFVRAQKLTPGKDVVFDIVNREKQYPLVVKVLKKETVKTAAGKFKCIVVEPQFRGEGIFVSKGKSLQVWLTDDEYKMPVKMKTEVFIGSVSAELLEYKRN